MGVRNSWEASATKRRKASRSEASSAKLTSRRPAIWLNWPASWPISSLRRTGARVDRSPPLIRPATLVSSRSGATNPRLTTRPTMTARSIAPNAA